MSDDLTWELHRNGTHHLYQQAHLLIGTVDVSNNGFTGNIYKAYRKLTKERRDFLAMSDAKDWVAKQRDRYQ